MINLSWYHTLNKPIFSPPSWVFAPMWTILYTTLFIALFFYIIQATHGKKLWGYILFFTQLLLNFCWTPVFFYYENIKLALIIVILLDILTLATMVLFYKISKKSAFWLIPYILWILFATYLNFGYLLLN